MPVEPLVPFSYRAGSIVTMEVWNFLTYTHSAIHPSSRLNLIVGPNGSGKSSIVCAMCLGLGGHPTLLGRGEKPQDYVKWGETKAVVEISLATGVGRDVVTLRREINTDEKRGSEWFLGGSHAAKPRKCLLKEIQAVVTKYNIQLGNYTQFLPQDIVKEFPALTPQQLLQRTEDALDDPTLKDKHRELIELKAASRDKDGEHRTKKEHLDDLQAQQEKMRGEVETFNEYNRLKAEIDKMQLRLPFLKYEIMQEKGRELKDLQKQTKKDFKDYDKKLTAAQKPLQEQKAKKVELDAEVKEKGAEKRRKENRHTKAQEDLRVLEEEMEEVMENLKEVDKEERKRQERMSKLREEIATQQQQYDHLEAAHAGDQGDAAARRQKLMKEKQGLLGEQRKAMEAVNKLKKDGGRLRNAISRVEESLQKERDAGSRILQKLKLPQFGGSDGLVQLARLVAENKRLFKKEVYCPIAMHISIRNPSFARFVETAVDKSVRCAFVTQDEADRETLNRLMQQNGIRGIRCINYAGDSRSDYSPPVPTAQLKKFGLLGYMDELFDAPDVVKWVLNDTAKLHQIAFGDVEAEQEVNNAAIFSAGVQALMTPNKFARASRSVHTGRVSYSTSAPSGKADVLGAGEDREEVDRLTQEKDDLEAQLEQLGTSYPRAKQTCTDIESRITFVSQEIDTLMQAGRERKSLEQKLKTSKVKLEKLQGAPSVEAQRERLRKQAVKMNDKRLKRLQDLVGSMRGYMTASAEHDIASLNASSMTEQIRNLEAAKRVAQDDWDRAKEIFDDIDQKFKECKDTLRSLRQRAQQTDVPQDLQDYWASLPPDHFLNDKEQLEEQIRTDQARADSMVTDVGGQEIVQRYKRAEDQIKKLQSEFESMEAEKEARTQKIAEVEQSWLPALRQRIEKINAAFGSAMAEMGFCGEVELREAKENPADEENSAFDYSNFAIDISVRFKEEQQLCKLNKNVQSGGEKSVSTMLYLVSLQELTDFPFRVVDEINQGMDARNERKMFEQIVRAASRDDCPQYFVITPKLLPGLDFNEAVTTHFVWNAPAMVALDFNHKDFNLSKHAVANNPSKRVRTG
jgi:chromosome segregation ATPase